jgi:hypothetical protein
MVVVAHINVWGFITADKKRIRPSVRERISDRGPGFRVFLLEGLSVQEFQGSRVIAFPPW